MGSWTQSPIGLQCPNCRVGLVPVLVPEGTPRLPRTAVLQAGEGARTPGERSDQGGQEGDGPSVRDGDPSVAAQMGRDTDGWSCPECRAVAELTRGGVRLDFSRFLVASETPQVRKVGLAYRFYSQAYAPLALLNMLAVWRAGLGRLVDHYVAALKGGAGPILDVAIGDGSLTRITLRKGRLAPDLIGLDLSPQMLSKAELTLGGATSFRSVLADARRLPFPDGSFRRACCFGGFHVIAHHEEALGEIARVLAPGGEFHASILLEPRGRLPRWLARFYVEQGFLSSTFSREGFLAGFVAAGFSPNQVIDNGSMLLVSARRT